MAPGRACRSGLRLRKLPSVPTPAGLQVLEGRAPPSLWLPVQLPYVFLLFHAHPFILLCDTAGFLKALVLK